MHFIIYIFTVDIFDFFFLVIVFSLLFCCCEKKYSDQKTTRGGNGSCKLTLPGRGLLRPEQKVKAGSEAETTEQ